MTTYDSNTGEFVINTPCESAQKYWIGGAANVRTLSPFFFFCSKLIYYNSSLPLICGLDLTDIFLYLFVACNTYNSLLTAQY